MKKKKNYPKKSDKPKIKHVFDFNNITEDHKALVREIIKLVKNKDEPDNKDLILNLTTLFKLEEEEIFNIENSSFIKFAKKINLPAALQGYVTHKENGKKPIMYPVISFCDDIRKFDKLIEVIMQELMLEIRSTNIIKK